VTITRIATRQVMKLGQPGTGSSRESSGSVTDVLGCYAVETRAPIHSSDVGLPGYWPAEKPVPRRRDRLRCHRQGKSCHQLPTPTMG